MPRNAELELRFLVLATSFLATCLPSRACEILSILSGENTLAIVKNLPQPPYPGYDSYLVRNNARGPDGILNNSIKGELVPARWGFDLRRPDGKVVAIIGHGLTVDEFENSTVCEKHKFTLRADPDSTMVVLNHGTPIGRIIAFPRKLLRQQ